MLKLSDTVKIATAKLRSRIFRSAFSALLISAVVFLLTLFIVSSGNFLSGLKTISSKGLSGKNLVHTANMPVEFNYDSPPQEAIDIAKRKYEQAKKKDPFTENPVVFDSYYGKYILKVTNPISIEAADEYVSAKFPKTTRADFNKIISNYNISKHILKSDWSLKSSRFGLFKDGKEEITVHLKDGRDDSLAYYLSQAGLTDIPVEGIFPLNKKVLQPNEIPILVNYNKAQTILGLKNLTSENQKDIFERNQFIRNNVIGKSFELCWRNSHSVEAIKNAVLANQDTSSEIKYQISESDCDNPKIIKGKDEEFTKSLPKLKSQKVVFRVVGVIPNMPNSDYSGGLSRLIKDISVSTIDNFMSPAFIPEKIARENLSGEILEIFKQEPSESSKLLRGEIDDIIEFPTIKEMEKFASEVHCDKDYCGKEKMLGVTIISNNYKVIDDINNSLNHFRALALIIALALATMVLYLNINRILIDSRKETAVFRAIGYSKKNIIQIYLGYVALFSLIVTIIANIALFAASLYISSYIEPNINLQLSNIFLLEDIYKFNLFPYSAKYILLFVPIFIVGVIASIIPLTINTRRSPLKNLRSEQ